MADASLNTPAIIYRKDYKKPDFLIKTVDLQFELAEKDTRVKARLTLQRDADAAADASLRLDGEQLDLQILEIDGLAVAEAHYQIDKDSLHIHQLPDQFELYTEVVIQPQDNASLSGLYQSSGNFCTQCEAEGFRRITYFLDRPDVMARYQTTITADKQKYPVLLSNGNKMNTQDLGDGRHQVKWIDPHPKPSYLFAVVAGDLRCHSGEFRTASGRDVRLEIWVEPQNIDFCEHALQSLKNAMLWDEQTYGREYDLDIYMIVAVNDFNMGAMENKGLNVFNAKYVLSSQTTATDQDFEDIEAVIGHEYFHNWTGNRVTCRDWFQLTLKEGLTVYRDECFTADMTSAPVKRIKDVDMLRLAQFPEDSGPMSHSIRPDSYMEMNNFYTSTVYNKGAAVIRMYETLLGKDGFRKGMDLYFQRHDGHAVTCNDFRAAMADANQVNLDQFERWYDQAGTPQIEAHGDYDAAKQRYTLTLSQTPLKADAHWQAWHIPVKIGLLDAEGNDMPLQLSNEAANSSDASLLNLTQAKQSFCFEQVKSAPIASLFRDFSAPINLNMDYDTEQLAFLMSYDSDPFNRREAGQTLAQQEILNLVTAIQQDQPLQLSKLFSDAFGKLLNDDSLDGTYRALALKLPDQRVLAQAMDVIDVDALHQAHRFMQHGLAEAHQSALLDIYRDQHDTGTYSKTADAVAKRHLKNRALSYLAHLDQVDYANIAELLQHQFKSANNMTDQQAALRCLLDREDDAFIEPLAEFYNTWQAYPLVLDKWFSVQAISSRTDSFQRVLDLSQHSDFTLKNPNRARSLLSVFSQNQVRFHQADGAAYVFYADQVLTMDAFNPQTASRLVSAFNQWKRFDTDRQHLMQAQLQRIHQHPNLSKDVYEIVNRSLNQA